MKEDMLHEYQNKLLLPRRAMPARKTIKEKDIVEKQPSNNWNKASEVNLFENSHSSPKLTEGLMRLWELKGVVK
jgi:hypothetical protein